MKITHISSGAVGSRLRYLPWKRKQVGSKDLKLRSQYRTSSLKPTEAGFKDAGYSARIASRIQSPRLLRPQKRKDVKIESETMAGKQIKREEETHLYQRIQTPPYQRHAPRRSIVF